MCTDQTFTTHGEEVVLAVSLELADAEGISLRPVTVHEPVARGVSCAHHGSGVAAGERHGVADFGHPRVPPAHEIASAAGQRLSADAAIRLRLPTRPD